MEVLGSRAQLGRSAGARLTVILLLAGNSRPVFWMAERTRSRASLTSVSARPTSVKLGRPLARWTSTQTGRASSPNKARLCTKDKLMKQLPCFAPKLCATCAPIWCSLFAWILERPMPRVEKQAGLRSIRPAALARYVLLNPAESEDLLWQPSESLNRSAPIFMRPENL